MARVSGTLKEKYFKEGFCKKELFLYKIEPDLFKQILIWKSWISQKQKKDYERAKSLIATNLLGPQSFDDYTISIWQHKSCTWWQTQISLNYTK